MLEYKYMEKQTYCSRCHTTEGAFIKYSKNDQGNQYYHCRDCCNKRARAYYATPSGKEAVRRAVIKAEKKFPERQAARHKVFRALKSGILVRPESCGICSKEARVQAHHIDYSKPLDVVWACTSCHAKLDRDQPRNQDKNKSYSESY